MLRNYEKIIRILAIWNFNYENQPESKESNLLIRLQSQIPIEFQRTTRTLSEFDRFKAVEFKFLLLYAGPIIFKRVLNDAAYKHFLFLHVACRILCSKKLALINYENAKKLLKQFVKISEKLYGKTSLIGNMHNLIHLADDVKNMGCSLSNVTAFPFENCLGKIMNLLRSGNRPLAQICRRLQEIYLIDIKKPLPTSSVQITSKLQKDISGNTIKRLKYNNSILTEKFPNNTVILENGTLMEITKINIPPEMDERAIQISGTTIKITKSLFKKPCDSNILEMWEVTRRHAEFITCPLISIRGKFVTFDISENQEKKIFTMPLLHI